MVQTRSLLIALLLLSGSSALAQPNPAPLPPPPAPYGQPYAQPYSYVPPEAAAPQRNGFYIGFSLGVGGLQFTDNDGNESDRENSIAFQLLRIGTALNPALLIGANIGGWGKTYESDFGEDATLTLVRVSVELTYYPILNPYAVDFFVRGGIGASSLAIEQGAFEASEEGGAAHVGLGIEKRLGRRFTLGGSLDFHYAKLTEDFNANYWELAAQFSWY
jgi:hypothetical protein